MRTVLVCLAACVGLVILIPILVLAAPFWIISAATRGLARLFEPAYMTKDQLIEFDPVFGWKPRPNLDTHHLMVDLFRIQTDGQGWRGRSTLADSDIVVFGDSFAAGYGVSEKHLFANLRQRPQVKPVGIGGYSMVQELLWMKSLAPALRGKLVVWFVYSARPIRQPQPRAPRYRKPFVREVRGAGGWESSPSTSGSVEDARATMKGHVQWRHCRVVLKRSWGSVPSSCEFLIRGQAICARRRASRGDDSRHHS